MTSWRTSWQVFVYIALLFFFVPIRIKGPIEINYKFQAYLEEFNKTYKDPETYGRRLRAFKESLNQIEHLNVHHFNDTALYGLTKFSDMLSDEFVHQHLQVNLSQRLFRFKYRKKRFSLPAIPQKVDWREKKAVTPVHDQGDCGSCWAFSAVETMESMHAIKNAILQDYSVDQILSCSPNSDGCNGGDVCSLLEWMSDTNFTLSLDAEFRKKRRCDAADNGIQLESFLCESFVDSEEFILMLLAFNGPVAVAVNARTWQNYIGGVIKYHCDGEPLNLNHAVQIVGYDLTARTPHYIVRNTWGRDFGDQGYLYIAVKENLCGLANEVAALQVL